MFLLTILRSPSIKATWYYATSGACFVLATLTLARVLPPAAFGVAALIIAISNVGIRGAPSGLMGVILRHDVVANRSLLRRAVQINLVVATSLGLFAAYAYGLRGMAPLVIALAIVSGGLALLGLVPFQKARRFHISVPLALVANPALLIAALLMSAVPLLKHPWMPTLFVAMVFGIVATWAWSAHLESKPQGESIDRRYVRDWISFSAFSIVAEVMWQLERLLIPVLLDIDQMAVFAVVAALTVAPYHVLSSAAGATLIPRLQAETEARSRRAVLARECYLLIGLSIAGGVLILLIAPLILEWYVGSQFAIGTGLLSIALLSGIARVLASIARAPSAAFCSVKELERISLGAWFSLGVAIAAAWSLTSLGLYGLIAGVSIGWLVRGVISIAVAWRHLS